MPRTDKGNGARRESVHFGLLSGKPEGLFRIKNHIGAIRSSGRSSPKYRWIMLVLGWLIYFTFFSWFAIAPILTAIISDLRMTYTEAGLILASVNMVYVAIAIPSGLFVDRVGVKKAAVIALTIMGFFGLVRGMSTSFLTLFVSSCLFGVGCTIISPAIPKIAAQWFPANQIGTATGILITGSTCGSGFIVAFMNNTILPLTSTWRGALYVLGLGTLGVAAIWLLFAKQRPSPQAPGFAALETKKPDMKTSFSKVVRSRNVWFLTLIAICYFGFHHGFFQWLPHMLESRGSSASEAGIIASVAIIGQVSSAIAIPIASDLLRLRKPFIMISSFVGGLLVFLIGTEMVQFSSLPILITAFGISVGGIFPIVSTMPAELEEVGTEHVGGALGMIHSIGHLGGFAIPLLVGYLKDVTGSFVLGMIAVAIVLMATIAFTLPLKETGKRALIKGQDRARRL